MPARKGLLAPQNTFLDTIANRFDGTHANFVLGNARVAKNPIVYCSDGFCDLTGYSRAQIMSKSCACDFLYGPKTEVQHRQAIMDALKTHQEFKIKLVLYKSSGIAFWCLLDIVPILDEKHEITFILCSHKDITKEKLNEEKQLQLAQLQQAKKAAVNHHQQQLQHHALELEPHQQQLDHHHFNQQQNQKLILDDNNDHEKKANYLSQNLQQYQLESPTNEEGKEVNLEEADEAELAAIANQNAIKNMNEFDLNNAIDDNNDFNLDPDDSGDDHDKNTTNQYSRRRSRAVLYQLSGHYGHGRRSVNMKSKLKLNANRMTIPEYKTTSIEKQRFILSHYGLLKSCWDWLILIVSFYVAIVVPYNATFKPIKDKDKEDGNISGECQIDSIDIIVEAVFLMDVLLNFRTTFVNRKGEVVTRPKIICKHYLRGWFLVDLCAALPFDLLCTLNIANRSRLDLNLLKLIRLLRLARLLQKMDRYSQYSYIILTLLMLIFSLLAHWCACIWYVIASEEIERNPDWKIGWLYQLSDKLNYSVVNTSDMLSSYVTALYFTTSSLTSVGFGNVSANTNAEKIFSILIMLIGALMHAVVFGNVTALIRVMYARRSNYQTRLRDLKDFFRLHQLPKELQQRMSDYFQTTWSLNHGIETYEILKDFPEELRGDVSLHLHREVLKLPIFETAPQGFLKSLAKHIESKFCCPTEYLIHRGDALNYLYLVCNGSMEVLQDNMVVAILGKGDLVGYDVNAHNGTPEHTLFSLNKTMLTGTLIKSSSDLKALTYCDLKCLHIPGLLEVLQFYPEFSDTFNREIIHDLSFNLREIHLDDETDNNNNLGICDANEDDDEEEDDDNEEDDDDDDEGDDDENDHQEGAQMNGGYGDDDEDDDENNRRRKKHYPPSPPPMNALMSPPTEEEEEEDDEEEHPVEEKRDMAHLYRSIPKSQDRKTRNNTNEIGRYDHEEEEEEERANHGADNNDILANEVDEEEDEEDDPDEEEEEDDDDDEEEKDQDDDDGAPPNGKGPPSSGDNNNNNEGGGGSSENNNNSNKGNSNNRDNSSYRRHSDGSDNSGSNNGAGIGEGDNNDSKTKLLSYVGASYEYAGKGDAASGEIVKSIVNINNRPDYQVLMSLNNEEQHNKRDGAANDVTPSAQTAIAAYSKRGKLVYEQAASAVAAEGGDEEEEDDGEEEEEEEEEFAKGRKETSDMTRLERRRLLRGKQDQRQGINEEDRQSLHSYDALLAANPSTSSHSHYGGRGRKENKIIYENDDCAYYEDAKNNEHQKLQRQKHQQQQQQQHKGLSKNKSDDSVLINMGNNAGCIGGAGTPTISSSASEKNKSFDYNSSINSKPCNKSTIRSIAGNSFGPAGARMLKSAIGGSSNNGGPSKPPLSFDLSRNTTAIVDRRRRSAGCIPRPLLIGNNALVFTKAASNSNSSPKEKIGQQQFGMKKQNHTSSLIHISEEGKQQCSPLSSSRIMASSGISKRSCLTSQLSASASSSINASGVQSNSNNNSVVKFEKKANIAGPSKKFTKEINSIQKSLDENMTTISTSVCELRGEINDLKLTMQNLMQLVIADKQQHQQQRNNILYSSNAIYQSRENYLTNCLITDPIIGKPENNVNRKITLSKQNKRSSSMENQKTDKQQQSNSSSNNHMLLLQQSQQQLNYIDKQKLSNLVRQSTLVSQSQQAGVDSIRSTEARKSLYQNYAASDKHKKPKDSDQILRSLSTTSLPLQPATDSKVNNEGRAMAIEKNKLAGFNYSCSSASNRSYIRPPFMPGGGVQADKSSSERTLSSNIHSSGQHQSTLLEEEPEGSNEQQPEARQTNLKSFVRTMSINSLHGLAGASASQFQCASASSGANDVVVVVDNNNNNNNNQATPSSLETTTTSSSSSSSTYSLAIARTASFNIDVSSSLRRNKRQLVANSPSNNMVQSRSQQQKPQQQQVDGSNNNTSSSSSIVIGDGSCEFLVGHNQVATAVDRKQPVVMMDKSSQLLIVNNPNHENNNNNNATRPLSSCSSSPLASFLLTNLKSNSGANLNTSDNDSGRSSSSVLSSSVNYLNNNNNQNPKNSASCLSNASRQQATPSGLANNIVQPPPPASNNSNNNNNNNNNRDNVYVAPHGLASPQQQTSSVVLVAPSIGGTSGAHQSQQPLNSQQHQQSASRGGSAGSGGRPAKMLVTMNDNDEAIRKRYTIDIDESCPPSTSSY